MSDVYHKLFSSIVTSTVWQEALPTKVVWVTMLALKRRDGNVYGSVPGLANIAGVSMDECVEALKRLSAPDPWSRTKDNEGRRIAEVDGGWAILNAKKFDQIRSDDEKRERMKNYMRERRAAAAELKAEPLAPVNPVNGSIPNSSSSSSKDQKTSSTNVLLVETRDGELSTPPPANRCPYEKIVELYHEVLPEMTRVYQLTEARRAQLKQRWTHDLKDLDQWRRFFEKFVRTSRFLMGKAQPAPGRKPFKGDLFWLTKLENFNQIVEGKYHG